MDWVATGLKMLRPNDIRFAAFEKGHDLAAFGFADAQRARDVYHNLDKPVPIGVGYAHPVIWVSGNRDFDCRWCLGTTTISDR